MECNNKQISQDLLKEYMDFVDQYGNCAKGLGWNNDYSCRVRYNRMLNVVDNLFENGKPSLLDVGCGFGGLYDYAIEKKIEVEYFGIDINYKSVEIATQKYDRNKFISADFLDYNFDMKFDYIVCNGILTFKNKATRFEMENYAKNLIHKMYDLCEVGIAFNILSTHVDNFSNLNFYMSPIEIMAYCMQNISQNVKVDHSYRFVDYTIYLYKNCEDRLNMHV